MSYSKEVRTQFANRALVVSELINVKFRARRFTGAVGRIVKVEPPPTESTGGGKMARETISLVPEAERVEAAPIIVGFLDVGQSTAELRDYQVLADRHHQRFGNLAFDLDRGEYDSFLEDLKKFLAEEGITAHVVTEAELEKKAEDAPSRTTSHATMRAAQPMQTPGRVQGTSAGDGGGGGLGIAGVIVGILIGLAVGIGVMLALR